MYDTEELILGSILSGATIPETLKPEDFEKVHCRMYFEQIKKMNSEKKLINIVSIWDEIQNTQLKEIGGGISWLANLPNSVPIGVDVDLFLSETIRELKTKHDIATISDLERVPSESEIARIKEKIFKDVEYFDKDGNQRIRHELKSDWYLIVAEFDTDLRYCQKFDYTMSCPVINYPDTEILRAAILNRLRHYVPVSKATGQSIDRILSFVKHKNRDSNRVFEFGRRMSEKHTGVKSDILDEFLYIFKFKNEENRKHYRVTFEKFFLKMWLHVQGTEKVFGHFRGLFPQDYVIILEGDQNIGKTTLCQYLACNNSDLYIDLGSSSGSFGSESTAKQVRGKLIGEIGEFSIFRKSSDIEQIKSFISQTSLNINVKFIEYSQAIPTVTSWLGTANNTEYLSDPTGNRRFFPILIESINKDLMKNNPQLIEKLHSYFFELAKSIDLFNRFDACLIPPETIAFFEGARDVATIKYADHTAIIEVVHLDFEEKENEGKKAHSLFDHTIEKLLTDKGFMKTHITKNGIKQAMQSMGYVRKQVRIGKFNNQGWWKEINPLQTELQIETEIKEIAQIKKDDFEKEDLPEIY